LLPPSYLPPQAGEGDTGFRRNDEVTGKTPKFSTLLVYTEIFHWPQHLIETNNEQTD